jgi:hypothetical protein
VRFLKSVPMLQGIIKVGLDECSNS